jgi:hypothetical protein
VHAFRFALNGQISPLAKAASADGYVPTRPMGGWIAPYGTLAADGRLVQSRDREGHIFEAARTIGQIDFSDYLRKGKWNDTHIKPKIWVGVPRLLEHHDETSELAKAHRVVGWWTEGHLFDRGDPRSWASFTDYEPTAQDLDRADYFWHIATMTKGLPRSLAFSAEGKMLLSPCKTRIIWAHVDGNAVCETPQIPTAVAMPLDLQKGKNTQIDIPMFSPDMVTARPCDTCRCPAGARCTPIAKAAAENTAAALVPEDLEGDDQAPDPEDSDDLTRLIRAVSMWGKCTEEQAKRWAKSFFSKRKSGDSI